VETPTQNTSRQLAWIPQYTHSVTRSRRAHQPSAAVKTSGAVSPCCGSIAIAKPILLRPHLRAAEP
jgi:hypothetical protein